jgi:hypothetical protein
LPAIGRTKDDSLETLINPVKGLIENGGGPNQATPHHFMKIERGIVVQ